LCIEAKSRKNVFFATFRFNIQAFSESGKRLLCSSSQFFPKLYIFFENLVVEGDVSLASVANDLGFDGRELNAMLAELPVIGDDPLENNPISVGDGFLGKIFITFVSREVQKSRSYSLFQRNETKKIRWRNR
jgi:hypothetical protein